ncbi:uncharacterized protein BDZ99DRAFT_492749 [Mytilinidion resinicola]|uniref:Uncharacterized protein n=1 Tax=Mytilinidion resinicola TaxID=574789 RepID=A0A6A6Z7W5_9PEZI|nr:uncharacterized protein BDZ99DRAFT_492749 [Mytilinidion resinicola]KAF2816793.1 hypothetical protein BDZ99DRAFT_492749 [Mytilinidion resinicola]
MVTISSNQVFRRYGLKIYKRPPTYSIQLHSLIQSPVHYVDPTNTGCCGQGPAGQASGGQPGGGAGSGGAGSGQEGAGKGGGAAKGAGKGLDDDPKNSPSRHTKEPTFPASRCATWGCGIVVQSGYVCPNCGAENPVKPRKPSK